MTFFRTFLGRSSTLGGFRSLSSTSEVVPADSVVGKSFQKWIVGGAVAAAGTAAAYTTSLSHAHGHSHSDPDLAAKVSQLEQIINKMNAKLEGQYGVRNTSGQGDAIFSWDQGLTAAFPADAKPFEKDMHGGFNEDVDTGIVYTGIPGYGLCEITPDLKTWKVIGSDDRLKANIHGIVVFKNKVGVTTIAVAQNDAQRVLIIGLDGTVQQQLDMPKGGEFNFDEANAYYSNAPTKMAPWGQPHKAAFAVTDVTFHPGNKQLYCVTGYCDGDFVLSATEGADGKWGWGPTAWGGKGDAPGKFNTAHGIFAWDDHIYVANREAHQVVKFTKDGKLVNCLPNIPDEARICNIARATENNYFIMNALQPIPHSPPKTAQIYAHSGEELLSTIDPGELGIPVLKHLHHTWPHYVTQADGSKQLYILVHGWSAGKFAVLKHEPNGEPSVPRAFGCA